MEDWRDKLGAAFGIDVTEVEPTGSEVEPEPATPQQQQGANRLDILLDRKGRKGKTATIVAGFVVDEVALKSIASSLKHRLSTGGSARGGEILLQGDYREAALAALKDMGFKARII